MSISRQQRRAMQRKMAGLTNDQAERMISALRDAGEAKKEEARKMAPGIVDDVVAKVQKEWEPVVRRKVRNEAVDEMLVLVMAFEHIDRGHTAQYLVKWLNEFMSFADAVTREGNGVDGLRKILLDECKLRVSDVCACEATSKKEAEAAS